MEGRKIFIENKPVVLIQAVAAVFGLAPSTADNAISSPGTLFTGQFLTTGNYQFIMHTDCNSVLYVYGNPIWASNTGDVARRCRVVIQEDGNLMIYTRLGRHMRASNMGGKKASYALVLRRDCNVVICGPAIWATNTQKVIVGITVVPQNSTNSAAAVAAAAAEQVIVSIA